MGSVALVARRAGRVVQERDATEQRVGEVMGLREQYDTSHGKYDRPFTAYLFERVILNGFSDESDSDEGSGDWIYRVGRRIVTGDDRGFIGSLRFDTVEQAKRQFTAITDTYYDEQDDED